MLISVMRCSARQQRWTTRTTRKAGRPTHDIAPAAKNTSGLSAAELVRAQKWSRLRPLRAAWCCVACYAAPKRVETMLDSKYGRRGGGKLLLRASCRAFELTCSRGFWDGGLAPGLRWFQSLSGDEERIPSLKFTQTRQAGRWDCMTVKPDKAQPSGTSSRSHTSEL